jgi:hypothetical protein
MNLPKFVKKTLLFIVTCDPCVSIDGFDYVVYNVKHPALFFFTRRSKTNGSLLLLFCWSSFCLLLYLFWLEAAVVKEAPNAAVVLAAGWLSEVIG